MSRRGLGIRLFVVAGVAVAVALALLVSPFASSAPDGLEKVAEEKGFASSAEDHSLGSSPLADYAVEGVEQERVSTGLAGVVGVLLTFAIGLALTAAARRLGRARAPVADGAT